MHGNSIYNKDTIKKGSVKEPFLVKTYAFYNKVVGQT
tara:strand:+ start:373 stop:483 length:111 start_codon:yes stop_codon:yes gene_type:complete